MRILVLMMSFMVLTGFDTPDMNKPGGWDEKDIPDEFKTNSSNAVNRVKSGDLGGIGLDKSSVENNAKSLNSIGDLEHEGRQKQMTEGELISSVIIDQSQPGMKAHANDANSIAKATEELLKNIGKVLKQNDIDCKEYKGYRELENSYHLRREVREDKHISNEPFFCELLRNKYDCKDDLEIHCLEFSSKKNDIRITGANFKYNIENGVMVMRNDYNPTTIYKDKIDDSWFKEYAVGYEAYLTTYQLAAADLIVSFDVDIAPEALSDFGLENLSYSGFVMVKLNDKVVFVGPYGGSDLRSLGYHHQVRVRRDRFLVFTVQDYFESYPVISTGNQEYWLGYNDTRNNTSIGFMDLKPYIKLGRNELVIKGLSADTGYVTTRMKAHERLCVKWSLDKWNETCVLKNN